MTQQPLTDQQLDDIEQRATAATPGPWCTDSWEIYQGREDDVPDLMKWIGETCRAEDSDGSRNDAAFIAHARTDVPALLAEIRRLKSQRKYLITQLAKRDAETRDADQKVLEFLGSEPDAPDTLPAWLYQRFAVIHGCPPWDQIDDGDRAYWERHAAAVRRAVARGGFKDAAVETDGTPA